MGGTEGCLGGCGARRKPSKDPNKWGGIRIAEVGETLAKPVVQSCQPLREVWHMEVQKLDTMRNGRESLIMKRVAL